jgi:uncharacterized membrane protein YoaK (UPF0700 family)
MKKQTTAAVTISGLAYGNIFTTNAIRSDIFNFKCYKKSKLLETISSPNN